MADLPSGTVTFLFTDVEGSTKLLHELGAEGYAAALGEHRRVIREACAAEGGVEVDTQGDAFFFAFPTAPGAVAAAEAMTEALAAGPLQVRIGLHTGMPLLTDEGYIGDDVHFAARVAATAPRRSSRSFEGDGGARRAGADRSRRASAEGHHGGGSDLPARRRLVPAAEDDLQHEPADAGVARLWAATTSCWRCCRDSRTARASSRSPVPAARERRVSRSRPRRRSYPSTRRASSGSGWPRSAIPRS